MRAIPGGMRPDRVTELARLRQLAGGALPDGGVLALLNHDP